MATARCRWRAANRSRSVSGMLCGILSATLGASSSAGTPDHASTSGMAISSAMAGPYSHRNRSATDAGGPWCCSRWPTAEAT